MLVAVVVSMIGYTVKQLHDDSQALKANNVELRLSAALAVEKISGLEAQLLLMRTAVADRYTATRASQDHLLVHNKLDDHEMRLRNLEKDHALSKALSDQKTLGNTLRPD